MRKKGKLIIRKKKRLRLGVAAVITKYIYIYANYTGDKDKEKITKEMCLTK